MIHSNRASHSSILAIVLTAIFVLQGCVSTLSTPTQESRHNALMRWNQCLERYDDDLTHYCDGHRRDILALFPIHQIGLHGS